jgi:hypothetical protein
VNQPSFTRTATFTTTVTATATATDTDTDTDTDTVVTVTATTPTTRYVMRVRKNAVAVLVPRYGIEGPVYLDGDADTTDGTGKSGSSSTVTFDEKTQTVTSAGVSFKVFQRIVVSINVETYLQSGRVKLKLVTPIVAGVSVPAQKDTVPAQKDIVPAQKDTVSAQKTALSDRQALASAPLATSVTGGAAASNGAKKGPPEAEAVVIDTQDGDEEPEPEPTSAVDPSTSSEKKTKKKSKKKKKKRKNSGAAEAGVGGAATAPAPADSLGSSAAKKLKADA